MLKRDKILVAFWLLFAGLAGIFTGNLWIAEAVVMGAVGILIVIDVLRHADSQPRPETEKPRVRSRVEHYAFLTKIKNSGRMAKSAANPFEMALLEERQWPRISVEKLDELAKNIA